MEFKIVETSLNLRVERKFGKKNKDYLLSKDVAEEQLKLGADVYCNVEYMECNNKKYMEAFKKAGYVPYKGLDSYNQRGILYMVRKDYLVKAIHMLENPHMMHIQIEKEGKKVDIITIRILVSGSDDADYISRKEQWNKILKYIDTLENKENLCLTGDFNHGVISEEYKEDQARQYFNYQMIVNSLKEKNISLASIDGMSYKGYMKIDHLCTSENLNVLDAAYVDVFGEHRIIGVPDHSMIVARIEVA
ncbi:MAG: endonuclease/exonuclease/phosphatase family protein [Lachnospiraceae bacterium]|uniref:endonuclease/exonuclease/phosphatase family protein n=1 Tax=Roseburia hominis TaxID=301301 RepID=UPI001F18E23C|nr:endonuclease/exonuclease/phosphatase family protein [Roseburia hominis]MDD6170094.1 endonuclease/exonuclease/phosphatase family protein [Lachnospiraceae bacterium]